VLFGNLVGAMILIPALIRIFQPNFAGGADKQPDVS
jgi:hypothetical protein